MDVEDGEIRIRRLIFIIMSNLLTQEDKTYLQRVGRYLRSMGMDYGEIDFEMESDDDEIWSDPEYYPTHFVNNYTAEIPTGLKPILTKIITYVNENNLFGDLPSEGYMDYQNFDIFIDARRGEISLNHRWSWVSEGGTTGIEYEDILSEWEEKGILDDIRIPEDQYLTLKYNGGGDEGYIDSNFGNGSPVPTKIEEWCYQQLEENFGGWEINEGSQGEFQFDFDTKVVELGHSYNTQDNSSDTLWEEDFKS